MLCPYSMECAIERIGYYAKILSTSGKKQQTQADKDNSC
jgi:hypothetical protein